MKYILGFLFGALLIGCQTGLVDPDPTPPPVVLKPEIQVFSADKMNLVFGETTTVTWQVLNATACSLAGKDVVIKGSILTVRLVKDTTIIIIATGNGGSATSSLTIKVGDWKTSKTGLLVGKTWGGLKSTKYFTDGILVSESILLDSQKNRPMTFTLEGQVKSSDGGVICQWSLSADEKTLIMGRTYKLVSLTETELVRSEELIYGGKPSVCEDTYWR